MPPRLRRSNFQVTGAHPYTGRDWVEPILNHRGDFWCGARSLRAYRIRDARTRGKWRIMDYPLVRLVYALRKTCWNEAESYRQAFNRLDLTDAEARSKCKAEIRKNRRLIGYALKKETRKMVMRNPTTLNITPEMVFAGLMREAQSDDNRSSDRVAAWTTLGKLLGMFIERQHVEIVSPQEREAKLRDALAKLGIEIKEKINGSYKISYDDGRSEAPAPRG